MNARAPIAHGGPQRLPARAAPSLVRALRVARGSPLWTPWTILCRLDWHHPFLQPVFVSTAQLAATLTPTLSARDGVITITGISDHLRLEWPITITGIIEGSARSRVMGAVERALQERGIAQKPD